MFKALRRWWKYLGAKVNSVFNTKADPKIQLEQAITEAQDQHRRLREQAANVIANQKQTEMRLDRAHGGAGEGHRQRHARPCSWPTRPPRPATRAKVAEYTSAAESFATRLIAIEGEVEDLKALALQSSQASDQAKAAVQQNATALQRKLSERNKLLSQLDQAKMQEQVNKAMASLSETVGEDVPTFDEVREKIEARYAKAKGMSELTESSVESRMLEVEQAAANSEAQARLAQIRAQLGLAPAARPRPRRRRRAGTRRGRVRLTDDVGVGPHPPPWPDDPRLDPELLAAGDRRNVADRYRYWTVEAIVADLDGRRHPFHVAIENWAHDLNIGTVVRNANAFLAGSRAHRGPAPVEPAGRDGDRPLPARRPPPHRR